MKTYLRHLPLMFLTLIGLSWGLYYQTSGVWNDFGRANFEWLFLVDALIVLPVLCLWFTDNVQQGVLKALVYGSLAVLIGSYIIPEQNKVLWPYLESGRYAVLALVLALEAFAIATVVLAVNTLLRSGEDPDCALQQPIRRYLGNTWVANLFAFETRMWTFAFWANKITTERYHGQHHFTYHQKDGARSNLMGFILLILFELPLMHVLLHFVWSPMAANIVTLLTLFSLVFFIAEYRATSRRPISIDHDRLLIRFGLYNVLQVPLTNIQGLEKHQGFVRRHPSVKRFNYAGAPNVLLTLRQPIGQVERIYLGLDNADLFIDTLSCEMRTSQT